MDYNFENNSDLMHRFGMVAELHNYDNINYVFLKLHLFCNDKMKQEIGVGMSETCLQRDIFYDTADFSYGRENKYLRERIVNGLSTFVQQDCPLNSPAHYYTERKMLELNFRNLGVQKIVSYDFKRYPCNFNWGDGWDCYVDEVLLPFPYTVLSFKKTLTVVMFDFRSIRAFLDTILKFRLGMDVCAFEHSAGNLFYYPISSKFMFFVRFTEKFYVYDEFYFKFNPAQYAISQQTNGMIAENRISKPEQKEYFFFVFVVFRYVQFGISMKKKPISDVYRDALIRGRKDLNKLISYNTDDF